MRQIAWFSLVLLWGFSAQAEAHGPGVSWDWHLAREVADGTLSILTVLIAAAPVRIWSGQGRRHIKAEWLYWVAASAIVLGTGLLLTAGSRMELGYRALVILVIVAVAILADRAVRLRRIGAGALVQTICLLAAHSVPAMRHGWPVYGTFLIHLAGASVWLGGLCWFALAPGTAEERQRFSDAAACGMALAMLSGLATSVLEREHGFAVNGPLLMAKHLLLVPVLALGWWHRRGRGGVWTLRAEALLGFSVLLLGVALTRLHP